MSDELRRLEDAKAEALAAFAAIATIIGRAGAPATAERTTAVASLREEAAGHLDAALAIVRQAGRR